MTWTRTNPETAGTVDQARRRVIRLLTFCSPTAAKLRTLLPQQFTSMDVPILVPIVLFGSIAFAVIGVGITCWVEGMGKY